MLKIGVLVWMMAGTTLAGIAVMVVLTVPSLAVHDMKYIPFAALADFVIAVPVAYVVTKRITAMTASS
ncbi:MAG TPA: hypothetical protein VE224_13205 [Pseudolabrys sp.]|jgi:hypothetical protein|nr:hypothetical protein [Pseudolabrys sp.]